MTFTEVIKSNIGENRSFSSVSDVNDDAVGVHWFVAVVRHNSELKVAEQLRNQGLEAYVATQPRLRIYASGRKKWVSQLIISSKVFVRCTEKQRLQVVHNPFVYRLLTNRSGDNVNGHRPVAVIPDKEIETLRFMLGQSDYPVDFQETPLNPGDSVKVIRGSLRGLEGKVIETSPTHKTFVIQLDLLGCAKLTLPSSDVALLS